MFFMESEAGLPFQDAPASPNFGAHDHLKQELPLPSETREELSVPTDSIIDALPKEEQIPEVLESLELPLAPSESAAVSSAQLSEISIPDTQPQMQYETSEQTPNIENMLVQSPNTLGLQEPQVELPMNPNTLETSLVGSPSTIGMDAPPLTESAKNQPLLKKSTGTKRKFATKSTGRPTPAPALSPTYYSQTAPVESSYASPGMPPAELSTWDPTQQAQSAQSPISSDQKPPAPLYQAQPLQQQQTYAQQIEMGNMQLTGGYGNGDGVNMPQREEFAFVKCSYCFKLRKVPAHAERQINPTNWSCYDNRWDPKHNSCSALQEDFREEEELEDCPFTEEELNEPLLLPNNEQSYQQIQTPYARQYQQPEYDQDGYNVFSSHRDDYYGRKPKRRRTTRGRPPIGRNSSGISLTSLLDNTDGVDPQYAGDRKSFYSNLESFLGRQPDVNLLSGAPVDLYQLYSEVVQRGGFEEVCQQKLWREIFRQLPQYSDRHTSASYALKKIYKKNLLEYEIAQKQH